MIPPDLIAYVRRQVAAGIPKENITKTLAQNGWSSQDIAEAFTAVAPAGAPVPAPAYAQPNQSSYAGRKVLLSLGLIIASAAYAFSQYGAQAQSSPAIATNVPGLGQTPPASTPVPSQSSAPATQISAQTGTTVKQTPATTAPPPTTPTPTPAPTPAPAPKPTGQYADGTYTGNPADAYYGTIQVKAVIQGGKIADVQFLQYPSDRSTSRYINGQAMPMLTSEAIQIQSANVDIISGATDSSMAFQQSLGSALALAKN